MSAAILTNIETAVFYDITSGTWNAICDGFHTVRKEWVKVELIGYATRKDAESDFRKVRAMLSAKARI
jgi:hypothetical protein